MLLFNFLDDRILTIHDCTGGEENILDMHVYTCGALLLIFYCSLY